MVTEDLKGRVVELLRITGAYGETTAFVSNEDLRKRLERWPVAVIPSEVYAVIGEPLLVEDLGFPDRRILENAYDSVRRDGDQVDRLWDALKDRNVIRRWDVELPPDFKDPGKVRLCSTSIPRVSVSEGEKAWKLSLVAERDPRLRDLAKAYNRSSNGGKIVCEACGFTDDLDAMFDAHHLRPISAGERQSRVDDLAILCPTCHRMAHHKSAEKVSPLPISKIKNLQLARF
ncbi:HNH endonuclease [Methylocapsa acidiphila]|uniref:HNH endonuclease n=1 Tax=Methylocapsa acidiphila TaxID=133552 RepID=UPI0018DE9C0B|nr:HNH endonuclease [Methylocapsa acidiphila]